MILRYQSPLLVVVLPFLLAVLAASQGMPQGKTKGGVEQQGFTWTETYEGSGNSDGFITDINSTIGYVFGKLCLVTTLSALEFNDMGRKSQI